MTITDILYIQKAYISQRSKVLILVWGFFHSVALRPLKLLNNLRLEQDLVYKPPRTDAIYTSRSKMDQLDVRSLYIPQSSRTTVKEIFIRKKNLLSLFLLFCKDTANRVSCETQKWFNNFTGFHFYAIIKRLLEYSFIFQPPPVVSVFNSVIPSILYHRTFCHLNPN
jgi:hypothetical protein